MFNLTQLFGVEGRRDFLSGFWPNEPYVHHGQIERFDKLNRISEFENTEQLLRTLDHPVDVVGVNGRRATVPRPLDAWDDYRNGDVMIYLTDLQMFPDISEMCASLAAELGVPKRFVTCEGFAANAGVPVNLHFDHESNFMIQMRGNKTWYFAKNTDLLNPLFAYFPDNPNRYYNNGINPYTGKQLPTTMPCNMAVAEVRPGTAIFLPRGYWHQTYTHTESFSIGFVINPPTLTELVLGFLQKRLHRTAEWRGHPLRIRDESDKAATIEQIDALIVELRSLTTLDGRAILDAYLAEDADHPRPLYPL